MTGGDLAKYDCRRRLRDGGSGHYNAARVVLAAKRHSDAKPLLRQLHWLPVGPTAAHSIQGGGSDAQSSYDRCSQLHVSQPAPRPTCSYTSNTIHGASTTDHRRQSVKNVGGVRLGSSLLLLFHLLFPPLPSPFLLSLPLPFPPSNLRSRTPSPAKASGELCKLPQWGLGRNPRRNRIWFILAL